MDWRGAGDACAIIDWHTQLLRSVFGLLSGVDYPEGRRRDAELLGGHLERLVLMQMEAATGVIHFPQQRGAGRGAAQRAGQQRRAQENARRSRMEQHEGRSRGKLQRKVEAQADAEV